MRALKIPGCGILDLPQQRQEIAAEIAKLGEDDALEGRNIAASYGSLLVRCAAAGAITEGRKVHQRIDEIGYAGDRYLASLLVRMYGSCGCIHEAELVFSAIGRPDIFSWNALIAAYARNGLLLRARKAFDEMPCRDAVSWNELLSAYTRCGRKDEARQIFSAMPSRDTISWTLLISAYACLGDLDQAFLLLKLMDLEGMQVDEVVLVTIIDHCSHFQNFHVGRLVHSSCTLQPYDCATATTLVNMYGKCGELDVAISVFNDSLKACWSSVVLWNSMISVCARNNRLDQAKALFDGMPMRNVVSYNTMISGFSKHGEPGRAFGTFLLMDLDGSRANAVTIIVVADACSQLGDIDRAQTVHLVADELGYARMDVKVDSAIVNMYGKCGRPELARAAFEGIVESNVVAWSALISAYSQNNLGHEAVEMFKTMNLEGIRPNIVTIVAVAEAIASLACATLVRLLEPFMQELRLEQDNDCTITLSNALLNMQAKCGNLHQAVATFGHLRYTNVVTWNTMIAAYAERGRVDDVNNTFCSMVLQGLEVTESCLVSVLTACAHAGTIEQGWLHFTSMVPDFGLEPCIEHYHCMVALLSRVGRADCAVDLVNSMPYIPSSVAITSLLDATKVNGGGTFNVPDVDEPDTGACYALVSTLYVTCTDVGAQPVHVRHVAPSNKR